MVAQPATSNKRKRKKNKKKVNKDKKEGRHAANEQVLSPDSKKNSITSPLLTTAIDEEKCDVDGSNLKMITGKRAASKRNETEDKPNVLSLHPEKKAKSQHNPNSFHSIIPSLSPSIINFLSTPPYAFPTMTPVQSTAIPLFLTHHDVFVRAVTGSGKTLAFLIPVVEMILRRTTLLKGRQIGALVLEPTRELARQTYIVAKDLCRCCGMHEPLLLVGGNTVGSRVEKESGVTMSAASSDLEMFQKLRSDIVVGTPGRVEDVLTRYDNIDVSELEVLVLDESDVLLDMGFEVTLTSILTRLPKMRRTGLFSATNTTGVKRLATKAGMRNPVVVDVAISAMQENERSIKAFKSDVHRQSTPPTLTNYYLVCPLTEKLSHLFAFLHQHSSEKVIIFFLTCACVEFYSAVLKQMKLPCKGYEYEALHGKLVQKRREKAMERFRERKCQDESNISGCVSNATNAGCALLCTDVAARGLDVSDVSWTIQFDAPVDPSSYVHRVGRSARAGRVGKSLVLLTRKEEAYVDFLRLRKVPLQELPYTEIGNRNSAFDGKKDDTVTKAKKIDDNLQPAEDESGDSCCAGTEPMGIDEGKLSLCNDYVNKSNEASSTASTICHGFIKSSFGPELFILDVLPKIRKLSMEDRDILEKGTKAYTSYIRAYKEHQCGFIFRFTSLDLGLLATSFSLLRLPKMPELRDKLGSINFRPAGQEINIHAIPFKDKVRETARQRRLASELAAGGKNAKQIKAEQRAAERAQKQKERRDAEIAKGRNPNKKRGRQAKIFDEWDELAKEERLYKKLRTKKISKEEYHRLMYGERKKDIDGEFDGDVSVGSDESSDIQS